MRVFDSIKETSSYFSVTESIVSKSLRSESKTVKGYKLKFI